MCSSFGLTLLGYNAAFATVPPCFSHKSIAASVYKNEHCLALKFAGKDILKPRAGL